VEGVKKDVNKIFELMCQVFLLPSKSRKPGGLHSEDGEVENNESFPSIHTQGFQTIRDELLELSTDIKICFLSFVVLPENQEVNKMMLFIAILPGEVKPKRHSQGVHGKYLIEHVEN
ncbi:unnamed protein product, partial [Brassica rapa subsp. narinosa]